MTEFIVAHISEVISIVALLVSLYIAFKQSKLSKKLEVQEERINLIHKVNDDEIVQQIDFEIYFPKCTEKYKELLRAKNDINTAKVDRKLYLDNLSECTQASVDMLEILFRTAEIQAEEDDDDSYAQHCKERELYYEDYPGGGIVPHNYITLSYAITSAENKYEKQKSKLLDAMKKTVK